MKVGSDLLTINCEHYKQPINTYYDSPFKHTSNTSKQPI